MDPSKKPLPPCCTLLVTSQHIITLRESLETRDKLTYNKNVDEDGGDSHQLLAVNSNIEILSFASVVDLTAMKIPDNEDNWCILVYKI